MKLYLSGPMTGYPNYNYKAFKKRAKFMREQGYEVFNPAEQFQGDQSLDWTEYMRVDIAALLECDGVDTLPGWQNSIGSRLEVAIAVALGIDVYPHDELPKGEDARDIVAQLIGLAEPEQPTSVKITESTLQEAQRLVHGDRGEAYGHPWDDFSKTAAIWSVILGTDVTPEQVALCMIGVKISRQLNKPKRDNAVDIAGYAETLQMVVDYRAKHGN